MSILVVALVLAGGLLIGAVGIGGVLVVPALTDAAGVPLDRAIAASMAGFLLTGLVAVTLRHKSPAGSVSGLWTLNLAALVGAVIGAAALDLIPGAAIRSFIAVVAIASGIHALAPQRATAERQRALPRFALASIGIAVGCGSALSGTGGPVMLLPILMLLGVPVRSGIAMAQVVQLPIALSATGINAMHGRVDLALAPVVGGLLVVGSLAGWRLAQHVETGTLKRIVAAGLVALGLWYAYATFFGQGA